MKKNNTPINKGNYSIETPQREVLFESIRGEGWQEEYKEYRALWASLPKEQKVRQYPLLVDFELSTVCNLKCPMCYTITDEFKNLVKAEFMDFDLFKKVIDEISGKVPAIRLSLRGEPTLHPNFIDSIKYAKSKGIKEVSSLTNASNLTPDFFEKIMKAGIDWLTISVDGIGEVYENIRKPLKFNETLEKIKTAKKIKDKNNYKKPVIKIQGIWPAIKENPSEFYNTFEPYVDLVAFNPLIDYLSNDEDILYEENFSCPQIYQRLVISADGKVLMCANDEKSQNIIGDANNEKIYDIWNGEKLTKIRDIHKQKDGFQVIDICKSCYVPRLTQGNETGVINGRSFIIKNYVNRSQVIGK